MIHNTPWSRLVIQKPILPKVNSDVNGEKLQELRKSDSTLSAQGVVYESRGVGTKTLSLSELKKEEIESSQPAKGNVIVAFKLPNEKTHRTIELSEESLEKLQKQFGRRDFFAREDGVVRLNGGAQEYVASWHQEIETKRGYGKADKDGNGKIEGEERADLNVGFSRNYDYDFIDDKVVAANTSIAGANYQKYGETSGFKKEGVENPTDEQGVLGYNMLVSQHLSFEDSIEKELDKTIKSDEDFDGVITLEEGLKREGGENYIEKALSQADAIHKYYMRHSLYEPPSGRLVNRIYGTSATDSDKVQIYEAMQKESEKGDYKPEKLQAFRS